jgi:amino acid adenylation domain-containing protein
MAETSALHRLFIDAAARHGGNVAVVEPGRGTITYRELDRLSDRVRDRLAAMGVRPGDRVAIYLRKSIDAMAAILGILKAGAAYVPVDPGAPPARDAYIAHNCAVTVVLIERRFVERFRAESETLGRVPAMFELGDVGGGTAIAEALDAADRRQPAVAVESTACACGDLAYILYTSGSTGRPKGVMLSHENAVSFVDWCSEVFEPTAADRFSAHAPMHFDLSILDIHVALKHGATLVLISEEASKDPQRLVELIEGERITIWYSAPSILALLAQFGRLDEHDLSSLRQVLFAGEVFAVKHLRRLTELLPRPRYFNLYGPTETNVCTWYEVKLPVPPERTAPYPIGKVCSHLAGRVVDDSGREVAFGEEGELVIAGRGVMQGYWADDEKTARGFIVDGDGRRWYRTGDIVVETAQDGYIYRGRRDRMVKRRGYRVELGEIEAALYRHPRIKEAAVVARPDEEAGVTITAFVAGADGKRLSLIEMKRFCSEHLPLYMIPDRFSWQQALPKTSTDKVDYQRLKELA